MHENCRVDMLDFLQGLAVGSLLLFDLGYFSGLFLGYFDRVEVVVGLSLSGEDIVPHRA